MGAWGELAFDNDEANDWAYDLADVDDLSLVEAAFSELESVSATYVDAHVACNALAACEVLARLQGNFGYRNAYTEKVEQWVGNQLQISVVEYRHKRHRGQPPHKQLQPTAQAASRRAACLQVRSPASRPCGEWPTKIRK